MVFNANNIRILSNVIDTKTYCHNIEKTYCHNIECSEMYSSELNNKYKMMK